MRRNFVKFLLGLAAASLVLTLPLSGCGFKLRGQATLPFSAAFVIAPGTSNVGNALRRTLSGQQKLASSLESAPIRINLEREAYRKNILALSGGGKVREYRLEYFIQLSVFDASGKTLVAPTDILLSNDYSYSDDQALAKEAEEASLNRAMEQDALRQILRRLSYLKAP